MNVILCDVHQCRMGHWNVYSLQLSRFTRLISDRLQITNYKLHTTDCSLESTSYKRHTNDRGLLSAVVVSFLVVLGIVLGRLGPRFGFLGADLESFGGSWGGLKGFGLLKLCFPGMMLK